MSLLSSSSSLVPSILNISMCPILLRCSIDLNKGPTRCQLVRPWTCVNILPAIYKRDFETMIDTCFFPLTSVLVGHPPLPSSATTLPRGSPTSIRTSSRQLIKWKRYTYLPLTSNIFTTIFATDHPPTNHPTPSFSPLTPRAHLPGVRNSIKQRGN